MATLSSTIKIGLNSSEVKRGMASMRQGFKRFGAEVKAAMAVAGAATVAYFHNFRQEMDRLGKLAKRLEESTDTLQRIGMAAQLAGVDLETVVKASQRLVRTLVQAEDGSKTYARALDALGLSAGNLLEMPLEEQLMALARAYQLSGRGGAELAAIQELLGRQGAELLPLLREGPEALAEAMAKAKPVSSSVIADMERLNDEMAVMGQHVKYAFGEVLTRVVKPMWSAWSYWIEQRLSRLIAFFGDIGAALTGDFDFTRSRAVHRSFQVDAEAERAQGARAPSAAGAVRAELEKAEAARREAVETGASGARQELLATEVRRLTEELRAAREESQFSYGA